MFDVYLLFYFLKGKTRRRKVFVDDRKKNRFSFERFKEISEGRKKATFVDKT
jgi:hypothetical protein